MPHILGRRGAIAVPVVSEEGVAGVSVHLELVGLTVPIQLLFQACRVGRRRVGVIFAKKRQRNPLRRPRFYWCNQTSACSDRRSRSR